MKKLYNITLLIFIALILSACSTKLTIKSIHPSQIDEKIHTVFVDRFTNDKINQTDEIKAKLSSAFLENKKLFKLKTNSFNTDATIKGEILESSLNYFIYYEQSINNLRCLTYEVDKKTKKRTCIQYVKRYIPCEKRDYKVKTKIEVLKNSSNELLFSKIYTKTKFEDVCYRDYGYPYYNSFHRNENSINSSLARQIASDFLDDISVHYKYFTLEVIEKVNSLKLSKTQEDSFDMAIDLIDDGYFNEAKNKLEEINKALNSKSWEILYNLALLQEKFENLKNAQNYYLKAKELTKNSKDLRQIQISLNRVNTNLSEKIKAISQLP